MSAAGGGSGRASRSSRSGGYAANSFRTEGIVVRTHRLGEADRIIEALTPQDGLVRFVAKGVRRSSSRFGAVVEPFMHVQLQISRGRGELHTLSQAQLITPYATALAADYELFSVGAALAEAVGRVPAVETDGHREQYRLFHGALAAVARRRHAPRMILASYLLRSLAAAGWAPTFTHCASCGAPGPHADLHLDRGGAVCPRCRPSGSIHPGAALLGLLAALAAGDWAVVDAAEEPAQRDAAGIVSAYLQFHVERRLVSLSVLDSLTALDTQYPVVATTDHRPQPPATAPREDPS
ncbi:MAG: DNA repair protein RecO [Micrococcus sp.]|nr:DNA repair protein RecO [Micrococcus sp.]